MIFLKLEGFDYISNFYRHKLYDKETRNYLLTTDDGASCFLNSSSFRQLKKGRIEDESLYNLLLLKGIIITAENFDNIVQRFKARYSFLSNQTSLHIVIPTHRCNLGCIYCFASSCDMMQKTQDSDMTPQVAAKTIEYIMKSPSRAITIEFQGGEPTVGFARIKQMVTLAKELNKTLKKDLHFALVSNFTLLTDEMVDWLIENGVTFCTSLDGPKFVHNQNRSFSKTLSISELDSSMNLVKMDARHGTYDKVVYWIERINNKYRQKKIPLQVNALMTITRHSLPYHKEIIDEYARLNINPINIRPLTVIGKAKDDYKNIGYSYDEFLQFYKKSLAYIEELSQKGTYINERIKDIFMQKIFFNIPTYHTDYESPCGAATGQIVYYTNGDIYTCNEALGRSEFILGNIFEDKWQDIFKKRETSKAILNSILESNIICDRCPYKPYCGTCMVENYYNESKFNFYPSRTQKHHEITFHAENIFDSIFDEIKKSF
jgi:uncharacterized protein